MKSCVIPSVDDMFTVSGVTVGAAVDVAFGVAVNGIDVDVDGSEVIEAGVAVGAGAVLVL